MNDQLAFDPDANEQKWGHFSTDLRVQAPRPAFGFPSVRLRNTTLLFLWFHLCLLTITSLSAADKSSPASKKPKGSASALAEKSVESLAENARQSVVVISHFGRDGKEDGIGAGFIVSSNGL